MKSMLLILLENEPGSLSRVVGLFSQRGYNIESISVSPTEDITLSSVIIKTTGDKKIIEQIEKQLHKLINVIKIQKIKKTKYIECEIALIKINSIGYEINQLQFILKTFKSTIVYMTSNIYIIQIHGSSNKINHFLHIMKKFSDITEITRSGVIAMNKNI